MLGKSLEHRSKGKTSEAIKKLIGLQPKEATVLHSGDEIIIPIEEVRVGDIILVKPGEKVPVDGIVVEGKSYVDESMLTGESIPVSKNIDAKVAAATINQNGALKILTEKVGNDTALAKIVALVQEAQGSKAPIAKLADVISGYFVPIVITIATISAIIWQLITGDITFTLRIFISVLVIACPCALGLATPTAIMVGTGRSADYGILIKNGTALETMHKIETIIFDKTGTLTEGSPSVTDIVTFNGFDEYDVLSLAASIEKMSEHPLGDAIVKRANELGLTLKEITEFNSISGKGIESTIDGKKIRIGNTKLIGDILTEKHIIESEKLAKEGKTPVFLEIDEVLAGIIAIADPVKATSHSAIKRLHDMGIKTAMITGDHKTTADAIARQVGIDMVISDVLPEDKATEVKKLQTDGFTVAMVGDGINDAPALAIADVGIAIGTGTDIAIESADVVLMATDLNNVVNSVKLSKATIRNIKQNLFWAFAYNTAGIPLAAGLVYAFGGPLLNPMFAAAAMSFSSVSVVTNALRLRNIKI
jgi:Cu+-exporting ATPase